MVLRLRLPPKAAAPCGSSSAKLVVPLIISIGVYVPEQKGTYVYREGEKRLNFKFFNQNMEVYTVRGFCIATDSPEKPLCYRYSRRFIGLSIWLMFINVSKKFPHL
jgi:hypothetical protein